MADVFQALTAHHPNRNAKSIADALAIIRKDVGFSDDANCFDQVSAALKDMQRETA